MKSIRRLILPEMPKILGAAIVGGISSSMAVGLLACSAWLISMASLQPPIMVLEVAIVSVRFFGIGRGVIRYAARIIEHKSALRALTTIRVALYRTIESQLPTYFALVRRGDLLRRLVSDSEVMQDLWLRIANPWIGALVSGLAGLGIISYLLPALSLVLSIIFVCAMFLVPFLSYFLSTNDAQREQEQKIFDAIVQACDSVQESLIFGYQDRVRGEISQAQGQLNKFDNKSGMASGFALFAQHIFTGASILISASFSVAAFRDHSLAGVNVAVLVLLPLAIFDGLTGLPAAFARLSTVLNSTNSVDALLASEKEISLEEAEPKLTVASIRFEGVQPSLPGIEIAPFSGFVSAGAPLLVTGKSGAGKSSLLNAFIGFLEYQGSITIDGVEARELTSLARIELSTILLQQDHLFSTSIRENLKIGNPEASDEQLLEVLEIVELRELITKVGLDTHIGAYGHNFSGGEKQRLKLARTLLRDRPIVFLDEPFEFLAIDQVERISQRVAERYRDKLLIIISHLPLSLI